MWEKSRFINTFTHQIRNSLPTSSCQFRIWQISSSCASSRPEKVFKTKRKLFLLRSLLHWRLGCTSSRYATATFWLQISHSLWVKQPPFLHREIFLVSSPDQLLDPLLKTTLFSCIYWLALDLAAKAACGVQGTDVCLAACGGERFKGK